MPFVGRTGASKESGGPDGRVMPWSRCGMRWERSRGDRTAIELFLAGVRGWGSVLQRRLDDAKPKPI